MQNLRWEAKLTILFYLGVSSARINPHPWRLPIPSVGLQHHQPIPLFEKSNVLVMYVLCLRMEVIICSI
jgi:hypothetical protein